MPEEIAVTTSTTQVTEPPANETPEQKYQRLYAPQATQLVDTSTALASTVQSLQQEIAQLRSELPRGVQTPPQTASTQSKLEWVEKIRQGDFEGAQQSMKTSIAAELQPMIEEARQRAYNDAISASQVNLEMDRYLNKVRSENPDILPFEKYLHGPVNERMQLAQSAGRVRSTSDFLREYKLAVTDEVGNLRNLGLQFRAAGKDEALIRTNDVLRSSTLSPQQVQSTQSTQTSQTQNEQGESTDDYFTRRKADEARRRGLS
jgi:hypothetical protein